MYPQKNQPETKTRESFPQIFAKMKQQVYKKKPLRIGMAFVFLLPKRLFDNIT
jgi:hypothetical protein